MSDAESQSAICILGSLEEEDDPRVGVLTPGPGGVGEAEDVDEPAREDAFDEGEGDFLNRRDHEKRLDSSLIM